MRRRRFLLLAAAAISLCRDAAPERALLGLFADPARGARLGRAYLSGLSVQPTASELAALIGRGLAGPGQLRRRVAALIEGDYRAERVLSVDGWLLSVTEARLCGLAALAVRTPPSSAPPAA